MALHVCLRFQLLLQLRPRPHFIPSVLVCSIIFDFAFALPIFTSWQYSGNNNSELRVREQSMTAAPSRAIQSLSDQLQV